MRLTQTERLVPTKNAYYVSAMGTIFKGENGLYRGNNLNIPIAYWFATV